MWNGGVLFFCDPVDMVRLSHVSKQYRMVHVSDPLWERWVAPIQEGTYLTRLAETNVLTATRKTLMHAYMMATTGKCFHCGAWTAEVNVLVLLPQCYHCFSCWAQTGLLTKSKAKVREGREGWREGGKGRRNGKEGWRGAGEKGGACRCSYFHRFTRPGKCPAFFKHLFFI